MRALNFRLFVPVLLCVLPACLSTDESTTLYVEPSGEVELIVYRDNMRSTDAKTSERDKKHQEWLREARTLASRELTRLREAGATEIRHEVLRDRPPFASVLKARFPSLESYARSIGLGADDKEAKMTLVREGKDKRRLRIEVAAKTKEAMEARALGKKTEARAEKTEAEPKSYPLFKIVPVGGKITQATGFIVSSTRDSATIDFAAIETLEDTGKAYELRLEWTN